MFNNCPFILGFNHNYLFCTNSQKPTHRIFQALFILIHAKVTTSLAHTVIIFMLKNPTGVPALVKTQRRYYLT